MLIEQVLDQNQNLWTCFTHLVCKNKLHKFPPPPAPHFSSGQAAEAQSLKPKKTGRSARLSWCVDGQASVVVRWPTTWVSSEKKSAVWALKSWTVCSMSASFFGDEGPTKTIEVLSMNGSLHCKIEWLEKDLIDSTDFVLDLSHRIGALKTSNHSGGMRFLVEERLLSQGQSWSQLGRPQQITVAFQSLTHDFDQELLLAAQNGDIQLVRTILEKFQDPNCQDADGASALFKASQAGHAEVVSLLLGRRADCEQGDSHMSPLMIAVRFWQAEVVKRLLEARASIEQSGESLQSPLQLAVSNSDMQMATLLAHFGAKMDQALQNGRTVLTMAAHCGDIHMVKCLLRARANINQSDEQGLTALTIAARRMQTPLIRLLVDTGADKDPIWRWLRYCVYLCKYISYKLWIYNI